MILWSLLLKKVVEKILNKSRTIIKWSAHTAFRFFHKKWLWTKDQLHVALPKGDPKDILITSNSPWVQLTSGFFHRKLANFAISRNTDIDCLDKNYNIVWIKIKNAAIFIQTILSFVLSRKIIKIYNDIAQKYANVTVKDFWKYEKLEHKKNNLKLDIDFLNSCKQLGVYPKFLMPNVSNEDALSIRKRLLCSAINKRNKELQHLSKELNLSEKIFIYTAFYYWLLHP